MNAPASLRSATPRHYTPRHKGSPMRITPKQALDAVSRVPPLLAGPVSSVSARGVNRPRGSLLGDRKDCGNRSYTEHLVAIAPIAAPNPALRLRSAKAHQAPMRTTRF